MPAPTYNNDIDKFPVNNGAPTLNASKADLNYNVHGDYAWALNASNSLRSFVPRIELKEYKVTSSAQLTQLKLSLAQNLSTVGSRLVFGAQIGNKLSTGYIGSIAVAGIAAITNTTTLLGFNANDPYEGLYQGDLTGFNYVLPYLSPDNMIASNIGTWNKVEESRTIQQLAKGAGAVGNAIAGDVGKTIAGYLGKEVKDIYEGASAINQAYLELTNPGVSKESVKAFAPSEIGDTLTTSFYLFNTQKQQDIQDNWNFLWTLTYQNLPNRKSINLMDPPCIYSVEVPGFKRFPWAVITGLKVQNVGTTRLIDITTGEIASVAQAANNANIKIIPEVYKVTINIQSLFMNSRNLFYYMKDGNTSTKINVRDLFNGQPEGFYGVYGGASGGGETGIL
jgi:hypothetical protein